MILLWTFKGHLWTSLTTNGGASSPRFSRICRLRSPECAARFRRAAWVAHRKARPHVALPNSIAMTGVTGVCYVCVICVSLSACLSLKFRKSYYILLLIVSFYCPGGSMWLRAAPLTKASPLVVVGNQNIVDKKILWVSLGGLRSRTPVLKTHALLCRKKIWVCPPPSERKLACSQETTSA